jgi:orotidine-5'-phosphate decarboxylase
MKPRERIILALDVSDHDEAIKIVHGFKDHIDIFKVGSELFTSVGPRLIKEINLMGKKVFLDLKFHDIPNTVTKSVLAAAKLRVFMLTVHTLGGLDMLKQAADALGKFAIENNITRPRLIGVTILTSMDQKALSDEIGVALRMSSQVKQLAKLARMAGLDGVVASAENATMIRSSAGEGFMIVTPGIRPSWASADDQKRTLTPKQAIRKGADYIVIGRAVLAQSDPIKALMRIHDEIKNA